MAFHDAGFEWKFQLWTCLQDRTSELHNPCVITASVLWLLNVWLVSVPWSNGERLPSLFPRLATKQKSANNIACSLNDTQERQFIEEVEAIQ